MMFVIDISGSMGQVNSIPQEEIEITPIFKTVKAINNAVDQILALNPETRIGITVYGTTSALLLPLGNYSVEDEIPFLSVESLGIYGTTQGLHFQLTINAKDNKTGQSVVKCANNAGMSSYDYHNGDTSKVRGSGNYVYEGTSGHREGEGTLEKPYKVGHITNQQAGLATGLQALADAGETTWISSTGQVRSHIPCMIHLTDGQASDISTIDEESNWYNVDITTDIAYTSRRTNGLYNVSQLSGNSMAIPTIFQTLMTASYYTTKVNKHYQENAREANIENAQDISIINYAIYASDSNPLANMEDGDKKTIIQAINNPKEFFKKDSTDVIIKGNDGEAGAYDLFEKWKDGEVVDDTYTGSNISIKLNASTSQIENNKYGITVDDIEKNINYIESENFLSTGFDGLDEVIKKIVQEQNARVKNPINDDENEAGVSNALSYVDPIGKYLKVTGVKKLLLFNKEYNIVRNESLDETTEGNEGSKIEKQFYSVVGDNGNYDEEIVNPEYNNNEMKFKLSDIKIYVEKSNEYDTSWDSQNSSNFDEAINIHIPAEALPMKLDRIEVDSADKVISYNSNLDTVLPLRLIYTVGISDTIKNDGNIDLTKISQEYFDANKEKVGNQEYVNLYSNLFTNQKYNDSNITIGNAATTFSPAKNDQFYYFQKNLTIYSTGSEGVLGKEGSVGEPVTQIDQITEDGTYYLQIDYYIPQTGADDSQGEKISYVVKRQGTEFFEGNEKNVVYYNTVKNEQVDAADTDVVVATKIGAKRVGNLIEMNSHKGTNETKTADTYYVPSYNDENMTVVSYMGNNGKISIKDALIQIVNTVETPENEDPDIDKRIKEKVKQEEFQFDITLGDNDSYNQTGSYNVVLLKRNEQGNWVREFEKVLVQTNNDGYIYDAQGVATEYHVGNSETDRTVREDGTIVASKEGIPTELQIVKDGVVTEEYQTTSEFKTKILEFKNGKVTTTLKDGEGIIIPGLPTGIQYFVAEHKLNEPEMNQEKTKHQKGFWFKDLKSNDETNIIDKDAQSIKGNLNAGIDDELYFINTLDVISLHVTKQWNDGEDDTRPESVAIKVKDGDSEVENVDLYGTLENEEDSKVVDENKDEDLNSWEYTFILNKYKENAEGNKELITAYTVDEDNPLEYKKEISGDIDSGFVIKNTKLINIPVEKIWNDTPDQEARRSNQVIFKLTNSQTLDEKTVELNKDNSWKSEFTDLLKYNEDGELIKYTLSEELDENIFYEQGKSVEVNTETESIQAKIENTFKRPTEKKSINVTKNWEDTDVEGASNKRPQQIKVTLHADGEIEEAEKIHEEILSQENDWKSTFTDLYVYDKNGNEITYSVTEEECSPDELHFYKKPPEISEDKQNSFVITNKSIYAKTTVRFVDENGEDIINPVEKEGTNGESFNTQEELNTAQIPEYYEEAEGDDFVNNNGEGTFGKDSEVIYHYITKKYPYKIEYLDQETNDTIYDSKRGTEKYGTEINASDYIEEIPGYNKDVLSDPPTIQIKVDNDGSVNVIKIYYTKRTDLSYTVKYEDEEGNTIHSPEVRLGQKFKDTVTEEALSILGYELAEDEQQQKKLEIGTEDNVITFKYKKKTNLSYTVKYYEVVNPGEANEQKLNQDLVAEEIIENQTFKDTINIEDAVDENGKPLKKEIEGFTYSFCMPEQLEINDPDSENVIILYYERKLLNYKIEFYYDFEKNTQKTIYDNEYYDTEITYSMISKYIENNKDRGYRIATPEDGKAQSPEINISSNGTTNLPLKIKEDTSENVINVYYITDLNQEKTLSYTVKYYKDSEEQTGEEINKSVNVQYLHDDNLEVDKDGIDTNAKFGNGYKLQKIVIKRPNETEEEVSDIPENVENGTTIEIYYEKGIFRYEIQYYYGGDLDPSRTEKGQAKYLDKITYTLSDKEGYSFERTDPVSGEIQIDYLEGNNIIKVYYTKNKYPYTVNYYYDGEKDNKATVTGEADFDSEIIYEANLKPGYELDKVNPSSGSIIIQTDASKNVINVYYKRKESKIKIKYVDKVRGTELATPVEVTGKVFDICDLTEYKQSFENYTLIVDPSVEGVEFKEDVVEEVTFYYAKTTKVTVKYLDRETNAELSKEEIPGWEGKEYKTEQKAIDGYIFTSSTGDTSGTMTENEITVIYYYAKSTKVVVEYRDKNSDKIIESMEIQGKQGDHYDTKQKDISGYVYDSSTNNTSGTMTKNEITVTYYYIKISEGVSEKHIDVKTGDVLYSKLHEGKEGDRYKTEPTTIEGYDIVKEKLPSNAEGVMTTGLIEVKYYYIRKTTVRVKHINDLTGETIVEEIMYGHQGDNYTTSERTFDNYIYRDNKKPENAKGQMDVIVDETGKITTEIEVCYYYVPKAGGVIERHIDIKSGKILDSEEHQGQEKAPYYIEAKEIEGYDLVKDKLPKNASGEMTKEVIEVNYYYIKKAKVIVEYTDKYSEENLKEVKDKPKGIVSSTEIIEGHEGDPYLTTEKTFENYEIAKEEYPDNAQGTMAVVRDKDNNVIDDIIHVKYYYIYNKSKITERYIDIMTGKEIKQPKIQEGLKEGVQYSITSDDIKGWDLVTDMSPKNIEGTTTKEGIEIKHYYIKKTKVTVQYIDKKAKKTLEEDIIEGHEGDNYETHDKKFEGMYLLSRPDNARGTMSKEEIVVKYYYANSSNKDIQGSNIVHTGNNIITLVGIMMITIMVNIIQIKTRKKGKHAK